LLEKELRDHFVCVEEYIEISGDDETGTVDKIIKKDKTKATIFVSMAKTTTSEFEFSFILYWFYKTFLIFP